MILHADMDAFYAAIEQRDRPELRGRPVIVGGSGPRSVVATASYEARRFGVHSAMPGTVARRLCPGGIFVPARMDRYAAVSEQVQAIFASFTPVVEPVSLDEAYLDVHGSEALFGDGPTIARAIQRRIREELGLTVSVGVASSKFVAKVASDLNKPEGLVVVEPGAERNFLAPLPVRCLSGAGPVFQRELSRHGLVTLGDLQRLTLPQAMSLFGQRSGRHLHQMAHGEDQRPVQPNRVAGSIGHEQTFTTDLTRVEQCHGVLLDMAEKVGRRLRESAQHAGGVRLKLRTTDFTTTLRQCRLDPATDDDLCLYRAATTTLARLWQEGIQIRLLGLTAMDLRPADPAVQGSLFGPPPTRDRDLLKTLDQIRSRFGSDALCRGSTLELRKHVRGTSHEGRPPQHQPLDHHLDHDRDQRRHGP